MPQKNKISKEHTDKLSILFVLLDFIDIEYVRKQFGYPKDGFKSIEEFERFSEDQEQRLKLYSIINNTLIKTSPIVNVTEFSESIRHVILFDEIDREKVYKINNSACSLGIQLNDDYSLDHGDLYIKFTPYTPVAKLHSFIDENLDNLRSLQKGSKAITSSPEKKSLPILSRDPERDELIRYIYSLCRKDKELAINTYLPKETGSDSTSRPQIDNVLLTVKIMKEIGYRGVTDSLVRKIGSSKRKKFYPLLK